MPKLYQKRNGEYYTKSAYRGTITTYQITDYGVDFLMNQYGITVDDEFSKDILFDLIDAGDAYTHGSGPGYIAEIYHNRTSLNSNNPIEDKTLPYWAWILIILFFYLFFNSFALSR